jgi:sugar phosphate isomerase/epimerase
LRSRDIKSSADFASRRGFDIVQLSIDSPRLFPENLDETERNEIRDCFEEKNIALCFHGPSDIPLMNRHDIIRDAGVKRLLELVDLAIELGGQSFIFHPGRLAFYSAGSNKVVFMEDRLPSGRLGYFSDSLIRLLDHAAGRISLCIEYTHNMPPGLLDIISRLLGERGMNLAWDIGYTDILPPNRRAQMLKFYNDNIRHVKIFHVHDITESGGHRALGTGSVNLPAYLDIISAVNADMILEVFPEKELIESVDYLNGLAANMNTLP